LITPEKIDEWIKEVEERPASGTVILRYIANRRCQQIGLDAMYPGASNPFPWMSEMIDLKKERNFFETRVIEYQTGGALSWD